MEEPEAWARGFLDYTVSRLRVAGHRGAWGAAALVFAAIAAGHVTGVDYFYEYAIDAYYEMLDAAEEARPLAEPRWAPLLSWLDEDAEALAAFEERLADSSTVLCAEPVLAAAALGLGAGSHPAQGWRRAGYAGRPGSYAIIVRKEGGKKCRILVPSPVYALMVAGLSAAGHNGPGSSLDAVVPDPAEIRRTVLESKTPYGQLSDWLRGLVEEKAKKALTTGTEEACKTRDLLVIRYRFDGLLEAVFEYLC